MLERPKPPSNQQSSQSVDTLHKEIKQLHQEIIFLKSMLSRLQNEFTHLKKEKR